MKPFKEFDVNQFVELLTIDCIGAVLLLIDLDDTLKLVEILAAITLVVYNIVKIRKSLKK